MSMATLQTRLADLITALGTDWKNIWAKIGSGTLNTTATNLIAAINEVKVTADSAAAGTTPDASTTVKGKVELATDAETTTGTDTVRATTPSNVKAAIDARLVSASSTVQGIVELATDAETLTGTDTSRATTPANVAAAITARTASATAQGIVELATDAEAITGTDTGRATTPANIAAVFTDRIDTSTSLGASNTKVSSQLAVKTYVDALLAAANAMVFKGVIDASANPNYPAASAGDVYRISVAGKIGGASGPNVEVGDTLLALADGLSAGNHATVGSSWNITQTNIDGAVTGPASSVSTDFATFSGTSGKVIQDSGITLDTDAALAANSNVRIPSQAAVKSYAQPLDSDLTAIAALSTTSTGRSVLTVADQAAFTALSAAASETLPGIIEIATQGETNTGTDDARAVTPLKVATRFTALIGNPDADLAAAYTTAKA